ncbi:MAG: SMP-30/gluconolactonase/LRE family protein, partial [Planctomycetota bacterium]|nr:SMP-30/gluconolactonase/LRE family protein [Planctomycetota bacterium]
GLGWIPGRVLGRSMTRRAFLPLATILLAPICLPAYVIYFAWWQSWPATSGLHDWAIEGGPDRVRLLKDLTLYLGLLCWSWPIVAWCVAGSAATTPAQHEEMLLLDGAGPWERFKERFRCDASGLVMGGLIVFLMTFNNTTCFDLAEIFTFGNELRAMESFGANSRDLFQAGLPAMTLGLIGALMLWIMMATRFERPVMRRRPASTGAWGVTLVIWTLGVGVPVSLMLFNLLGRGFVSQGQEFFRLYWNDLLWSIGVAATSGVVGVVVASGMLLLWQSERSWIRGLGHVITIGWLASALLPGALIGEALESAYNVALFASDAGQSGMDSVVSSPSESNTQVLERLYQTPVIVILGHLARFGFIAALLARWLARREPSTLRDQRRLDGDDSLTGFTRAAGPRLLALVLGTGAIIFVLSLSEIAVTARVNPASTNQPISLAILNAMHYQRPGTVMIASLALIGFAMLAAMLVSFIAIASKGRSRPAMGMPLLGFLFLGIAGGVAGCSPSGEPDTPLSTKLMWGTAGQSFGQFHYPRAIAVDDERQFVYVVDKSARIQQFDFEGTPLSHWRMPEWEMGKPTGLNVSPEGQIFVADTHYFRIMVFDDQGVEIQRFGSYGTEPGQFIYPTDVEFGSEGELYVAEYGGNDRIQVFTSQGEILFSFGSFGSDRNQFNRPQSMIFNSTKDELFIADACNHRIVVVDPKGEVLRTFGEAGQEPGRLSYPYDLMLLEDGSLLVCEFGNNRLQRFSPQGESLGIYGRLGFDRGELQYPWGVDGTPDAIFVVDSGNNRVQMFRSPT